MANIAFTKLGLKKNQEVKTIVLNEQNIEVKQYLPMNDKLDLMGKVLTDSQDENNFANPIKLEIFTNLYLIKFYTNITFTEKQWEDIPKLYDLLESNKVFDLIRESIPVDEISAIEEGIKKSADAVYTYRNSVMGVIEILGKDYNVAQFDLENLQNLLSNNSEELDMLKKIMPLTNEVL